jgi:methylenetetrahydrofolate reductase (NADPH)
MMPGGPKGTTMATMLRRRKKTLSDLEQTALRALVEAAKYEVIPLKNAREQSAFLPAGSVVTVTASPSHGIDATFDLCEFLTTLDSLTVVPHLSAHMVADRAKLADLLARAKELGFTKALVIGGDPAEQTEFDDALQLLTAMEELGHPFTEIGIGAYPDGHVDIPREVLARSLHDKQRFAGYMATQMCFDPDAIGSWLAATRADGIELPLHLGIPGVADITKLMTIAAKIGVGDSAKFLKKNRSLIGTVITGKFGPDGILEALAPVLADPASNATALHVFTFNQVEATVAWRQRMLDRLAG